MKIAIVCQSLLLERALKLFLKPYVAPLKQCDFVVCDHQLETNLPQFKIKTPDANLPFPFSKSSLIHSLEEFFRTIKDTNSTAVKGLTDSKKRDFSLLENRLNEICAEFNAKIIKTVKEHYGQ
jgi:hypothetical protein